MTTALRTAALVAITALAVSCERCGDHPAPSSQKKAPALTAKPGHPKRPPSKPSAGFVRVAAGAFTMGSPTDELGRYTNEQRHRVTLTREYELAATEVTQSQFEALMGYNPSRLKGCAKCPVETVSWHEAAAYCNALSRKGGKATCYRCTGEGKDISCEPAPAYSAEKVYDCPGYRLPTDAEWEHAYRAGTNTPLYTGAAPQQITSCTEKDPAADALGWYCQNAGGRPHEVATKPPNPHGLYDLAGNVWEWCHDRYAAMLRHDVSDPWGVADSPMRVTRGGSWKYFSRGMRAACRAWNRPSYRGARHGFRPARTLL